MKILLYGRLTDSIGREVDLDVAAGSSIAAIRQRLAAAYPQAAPTLGSGRVRACVNGRVVADDYLVEANGPVEFLPPVSGG